MKLALFDLDHTLLHGDTDVLWCEFLMDQGLLERAQFAARNAELEARYQAGTVEREEFAHFYVGTLAGRSPEQWEPWRARFRDTVLLSRIGHAARQLVRAHQQAGDLVVMTTATNRYLAQPSADSLGFAHLIATEPELHEGVFSGRTTGQLNMREGKVLRLQAWLSERGLGLDQVHSSAYSDSINDLALLQAVQRPVAVNPDARLAAHAQSCAWEILHLVH